MKDYSTALFSNIRELHVVYQTLCKTDDGLLGYREISQMLTAIGVKATASQLQDIINEVVGDEAKIDFNAFVLLMTRRYKQLSFEDEIDELFETIDAGHDNFIDPQDVIALMQSKGITVTPGEAEALLATISDSAKGMNKSEFQSFVKSLGAIVMTAKPEESAQ
ncbi:EF hand family protein [Trichomonas vaginalis G3]|uniref:EF hand family protein n=1 Tax=Trichomonas vaginalis (strain ATCC PRA-98 / G3) TaxID=412133 RepID=A2FS38_TRIV3|nr:calcium-binding protein family [Trichomonas vaginalis G3]EAX92280.1 EF hand family protein [Trichomonas vaginalis G3]KAI5530129.1 calcium-binding protein family [Trichomonas vaginalis G3]|eukprot:XP_001305210.1 EF hand family protein [Trichomonas vaginalis G3]